MSLPRDCSKTERLNSKSFPFPLPYLFFHFHFGAPISVSTFPFPLTFALTGKVVITVANAIAPTAPSLLNTIYGASWKPKRHAGMEKFIIQFIWNVKFNKVRFI